MNSDNSSRQLEVSVSNIKSFIESGLRQFKEVDNDEDVKLEFKTDLTKVKDTDTVLISLTTSKRQGAQVINHNGG